MVRRNRPSSGEFARLWDSLPPSQQERLIEQFRAALRGVGKAGEPQRKPAPRHARFERGQVQVLASARRPPPMNPQQQARFDRAFGRAAATAAQIQLRGHR
jgi:hypothetical protein